jgi:hypothetical protein
MFGYYAIKAWDSDEFWDNMKSEKGNPYWSLFATFVEEMKRQESVLFSIYHSPQRLHAALKL